MDRLTPLTEISDFSRPAEDLRGLLQRADNTDIAEEFPPTALRYGGAVSETKANLEKARDLYKVGSREQFIVFSGEQAVGLCIITNQIDIPDGIKPMTPNISGFISHPLRGTGLGRLSIEGRMKVIKENFNSRAWTFVKDGNLTSEYLVTDVGFRKSDRVIDDWKGHHLYLFGDTDIE